MDYPLKRGWELGGPLSRACVVEDNGCLRQIPCCALVSNFAPPARLCNSEKGGDAEEALLLLRDSKITENESLHLLHELGHVIHGLLS
ncbi:hypothetical protein ETH_00035800, partial [Eimeria tenella]